MSAIEKGKAIAEIYKSSPAPAVLHSEKGENRGRPFRKDKKLDFSLAF